MWKEAEADLREEKRCLAEVWSCLRSERVLCLQVNKSSVDRDKRGGGSGPQGCTVPSVAPPPHPRSIARGLLQPQVPLPDLSKPWAPTQKRVRL